MKNKKIVRVKLGEKFKVGNRTVVINTKRNQSTETNNVEVKKRK